MMAAWRLQSLMLLVLVTAFLVFLLPIERLTTCHCPEKCHYPGHHQPSFEEVLGKRDIIVYGDQELNKTLGQYEEYYKGKLGVTSAPAPTKGNLQKPGWVLDCVTWEEKWEVPGHDRLHNFLMDVFHLGLGEDHGRRQDTFQQIYDKRDWPATDPSYHGLQSSGPGAMLKHAQGIMAALHVIVTKIKEKLGKSQITMLDLPCGDLQWMSQFLVTRNDILYTGADIVPDIISHHKEVFGRIPRTKFIHHDIVRSPLNESYDLILSRDLLQHLWMVDAVQALDHLSASKSKFLLVTTYSDNLGNKEVEKEALGGRKSGYNLELAPFFLESPICISYDWNVEHVGLWPLPLRQKFDQK